MKRADIGLVRIAVPELDDGFGAVNGREMEARLQSTCKWLGQAQRHALATGRPFSIVAVEAHHVVALLRQVRVFVPARRCNTGTERAGYLRPPVILDLQTEAPVRWNRLVGVAVGLVPRSGMGDFDHHLTVRSVRQISIGAQDAPYA